MWYNSCVLAADSSDISHKGAQFGQNHTFYPIFQAYQLWALVTMATTNENIILLLSMYIWQMYFMSTSNNQAISSNTALHDHSENGQNCQNCKFSNSDDLGMTSRWPWPIFNTSEKIDIMRAWVVLIISCRGKYPPNVLSSDKLFKNDQFFSFGLGQVQGWPLDDLQQKRSFKVKF